MANLDAYTKSFLIQATTGYGGSTAGSTGDALGFSTATGFPYGSTVIDTAGYEGVLVTSVAFNSTFSSLKAMGGQSSGSSTAYNDLTGAAVSATTTAGTNPSTAKHALVLDLYRPRNRWVAFQGSVPSTSGSIISMTAVLYGPKKSPPTNDASIANSTTAVSPSS